MQVDELTLESWDDLVHYSPQANPYARSTFIGCMDVPVRLMAFDFGKGERIGLMVSTPNALDAASPFSYSCYQGIFFPPTKATPIRRHNQLTEILAFVENEIASCCLSLHPTISDVRAAQWHNYGTEKRKYRVDIRYTGLIDLDYVRRLGLRSVISSSRAGDLKKCERSQSLVSPSDDVEAFLRLYRATFQRQGYIIKDDEIKLVERVVLKHIADGAATLLAATIAGECHAAAVFLHDDATAYYAFGAQAPLLRDLGGGTAVFAAGMEMAVARGLARIDTVGINSPSRGNFKLGFGAVPQLYFNLVLNQKPRQ